MDAEVLTLPDASFDVALCALDLCTCPIPSRLCGRCPGCCAREVACLSPSGENARTADGPRCFQSSMPRSRARYVRCSFVSGSEDTLARLCADAQFEGTRLRRITATLTFGDAKQACDAAFIGGPVALAWSRFNDEVRDRVRARYLSAIDRVGTATNTASQENLSLLRR